MLVLLYERSERVFSYRYEPAKKRGNLQWLGIRILLLRDVEGFGLWREDPFERRIAEMSDGESDKRAAYGGVAGNVEAYGSNG